MDQFFTSLNKRQSMLLLTAITFGGQEGVAALDFLTTDERELLQHRAQEIIQIPREKRIPLLVQEIKRLVKDRRGQLWSAEPEKLAELLRQERGALVEVVLRALPGVLAEAVREHVPVKPVKLTREVRPQVLDIVRWKLEQRLSRSAGGGLVSFKFTDVLMLQTRELLTVCDRLGARVLGPALAGLPEEQREGMIAPLPPDQKQLAVKAIAANAPRKLPEEEAKAQLEVHDGLKNLSGAIRGAGVQRLARACLSQSAEFAARMLEKHRGEFGSLLARWIRDERSRPISRTTDGGRADIVADLERLAVRGLIERPVRLTPQRPALSPPPVRSAAPRSSAPQSAREPIPSPVRAPSREARPSAVQPPAPRRDLMAEREARRAGVPSAVMQGEGASRRDPMAERAARRAGALSSFSEESHPEEAAPEVPRKLRLPEPPSTGAREAMGSRRGPAASPSPSRASTAPPPGREASRAGPPRQPPPEGREGSRAGVRRPSSQAGAPPAEPRREREASRPAASSSARVAPRPVARPSTVEDPDSGRVISSPGIRIRNSGVRSSPTEQEPERPPRVLSGRSTANTDTPPPRGEGAGVQRPRREPPPSNSGRGPRGGTR